MSSPSTNSLLTKIQESAKTVEDKDLSQILTKISSAIKQGDLLVNDDKIVSAQTKDESYSSPAEVEVLRQIVTQLTSCQYGNRLEPTDKEQLLNNVYDVCRDVFKINPEIVSGDSAFIKAIPVVVGEVV